MGGGGALNILSMPQGLESRSGANRTGPRQKDNQSVAFNAPPHTHTPPIRDESPGSKELVIPLGPPRQAHVFC